MKRREFVMEFRAPVYVIVQQNEHGARYVSKVIVDDENTDMTSGELFEDGKPIHNPQLHKEIQAVINDAQEFPAWEFGW